MNHQPNLAYIDTYDLATSQRHGEQWPRHKYRARKRRHRRGVQRHTTQEAS